MSGTITSALRTAQSGLLTIQSALDAVANNIANVNSAGYSRKIVSTDTRVVAGAGAGVQISEITRAIDENLLKSLRMEISSFHNYETQQSFYERIQTIFGAPSDNNSISHNISQFTQALQSLSLSPEKSVDQTEMVRRARDMTQQLQDMSTTIQELRLVADQSITSTVAEINRLSASLGDLNDKIIRNQSSSRDVTDLKDQRDQGIDELAKLIDIRYFYRSDGDVVVFTSAGRTLVDNVPATLTHAAASSVTATTTHAEGDLAGLYVGTPIAGNDITNDIAGGSLKGYIDLRDTVLPNMQSQLDELAAEIRDNFNQIHNRGVAFPGHQSMTGTRNFVDSNAQTLTYSGTEDTAVTLFDNSGNQSATTTIRTLTGGAGPFTVDAMAAALQTWLQANGTATATVTAASGQLVVSLNSTSQNLTFRDQATSTAGSAAGDATISFDANADLVTDETVSGFTNFFGLNDFFVDGLPDNIHESDVIDSGFSASAATLTFRDSTGLLGSVAVASGDGLSEIAAKINAANVTVTATVVPDGSGNRLRFSHNNGASMTVTEAGANTLLTTLGMHKADVRVASSLSVRADIATTPSKIASGAVQWDATRGTGGEYLVSIGDDTTISAMVAAFTGTNAFDQSGGLADLTISFEDYAAAILSTSANMSNTNETNRIYQEDLVSSLQLKSDSVRGVNLDEEMANLILFEQAYSSAARIISVIQKMFDALESTVR